MNKLLSTPLEIARPKGPSGAQAPLEAKRNIVSTRITKPLTGQVRARFLTGSISVSRALAAFLVVVLVYSPLSPIVSYAQTDTRTFEAQVCERDGGTWDGVSCDMPPTIASQSDVNAQASSDTGAVVSYTSPATLDDVDGAGTASCTPPSDSTFAVGTSVVTCTATDTAGNSVTSTFNVIVADITPPVIAPHADESIQATSDSGAIVSYSPPATSDDVDPAGAALCTPPSDSTFAVGTTTVTCTASDAAGNAATPTTFDIVVAAMPEPEAPPVATTTPDTGSTDSPQASTTTPPTTDATSTPETDSTPSSDSQSSQNATTGTAGQASSPQAATSTPDTSTGTSTPPTTGSETSTTSTSPTDTVTDIDPTTASSTASTGSGEVAPEESDTDNTDFNNVTDGPTPDDTQPVCDIQPDQVVGCEQIAPDATSITEALAIDPLLMVATSTDGTGSKVGGTIFTGNATASTTVKNILNITRSNVDGPGETNSSRITVDTDNIGDVTTTDETLAYTGDNRGLGGVGDATIRTGRANASAQVMNVVNTNFFNSEGQVLFLKPQNGDGLDLRDTDLSYFLDGGVGASPTRLGCTILTCLNSATLQVLNKNVGEVNNDVHVRAATGDNAATSTRDGGVDIQTGNAYASAAVLNLVNTNFINSKYLLASFDNFGDVQGDIVLPDATFFNTFFKNGNTLPEMNSSSYIVSNDNDETFLGTTTANAITGGISQQAQAKATAR